jgi:hypothetical protein
VYHIPKQEGQFEDDTVNIRVGYFLILQTFSLTNLTFVFKNKKKKSLLFALNYSKQKYIIE